MMNYSSTSVYEYPPLQQVWPANGKPLFRKVRSPYFLQVTEEILGEIVRRIMSTFAPEKIILFGSYAYGAPAPDSDVDLLVIQKTDLRRVERTVAISQLILPHPYSCGYSCKNTNRDSGRNASKLHCSKKFSAGDGCFMCSPTDPQAWIDKAEEDYKIAQLTLRRKQPLTYGAT